MCPFWVPGLVGRLMVDGERFTVISQPRSPLPPEVGRKPTAVNRQPYTVRGAPRCAICKDISEMYLPTTRYIAARQRRTPCSATFATIGTGTDTSHQARAPSGDGTPPS